LADQFNFFIKRVKNYNPIGRNQNEEESDNIAKELQEVLEDLKISLTHIDGDWYAPDKIKKFIDDKLTFPVGWKIIYT
jgi:hypothetical protein